MTVEPGSLLNKADVPIKSSLWSHYESTLHEVKKHVESKTSDLGFVGIDIKKQTIAATERNVVIELAFLGGCDQVFSVNIFLRDEAGRDKSVHQLTDTLVTQAKTISFEAVSTAIKRAREISSKNIVLVNKMPEDIRIFTLACLEEVKGEEEDWQNAVFIEIPKRNLIEWPPGKMALTIVKYFGRYVGE